MNPAGVLFKNYIPAFHTTPLGDHTTIKRKNYTYSLTLVEVDWQCTRIVDLEPKYLESLGN